MNQVVLTGAALRDPEMKRFGSDNSGKRVYFPLSVRQNGKDKDGAHKYFSVMIVAFGAQADYLYARVTRGATMLVSGHLNIYYDADRCVSYTSVVAESVELFTGRRYGVSDVPASNQPMNIDASDFDDGAPPVYRSQEQIKSALAASYSSELSAASNSTHSQLPPDPYGDDDDDLPF